MHLLLLVHHDVVFRLALGGGVHGGHADQVILAGVEFDWRIFHLGGNAGEFRFALSIGVDGHVQLVRSHESVGGVVLDLRGIDRFAVAGCHGEFYGAGARTGVGDRDFIRLLRLGRLLGLRGMNEDAADHRKQESANNAGYGAHKML